jgi:hypothetical protein
MHLQLRRLKLGAFIEKFAYSENALDETFDYIYYLIAAEENMYKVLTEFKMRNPYALKFAGVYTSKSDRKGRDIKLGDKQAEINDFLGKYMRLTREYASDVFRFKSEKHQEKVKEIINNIEELIDLFRNYLEMHPDPAPEDFEP